MKNYVIFFLLLGIGIWVACDLAVPSEEESGDVEMGDIETLKDVISSDISTDITIGDTMPDDSELPDIVVKECETDRDCNTEKPHCKNGVCVACITSGDCKTGFICNENNECVYKESKCQKNSDCDMGYICNKDGVCVEGCVTDKDCPPASRPNSKLCDTRLENPVCVECLLDNDCVKANLGTKCDKGVCTTITCDPPCKSWEHCTNEGKCELNDGACNTDKDCQIIDPSKVCNINTHTCEFKPQCNVDKDCDAVCPQCGGYCRVGKCDCIINCPKKHLCEQCADDSECETGLVCKGLLGTKYCQPQNCTSSNDCGGKYCIGGYCACGL